MNASTELPTVACLCPTYGRPKHLIANTIQCFLDQDYPTELRMLLICDDLGNLSMDFSSLNSRGVHLISGKDRFNSLPAKYNRMRNLAHADVQLIWEDDELYLPHHISSYVKALSSSEWAHPSRVWSTYGGTVHQEASGGRFHAALGFRSSFLDSIGGWPVTDEPNFDQQLIALAKRHAEPGRPDEQSSDGPSYVFRWQDTGATHGQNTMDRGNDWYRAAQPQVTDPVHITLDDVRLDPSASITIAAISGK